MAQISSESGTLQPLADPAPKAGYGGYPQGSPADDPRIEDEDIHYRLEAGDVVVADNGKFAKRGGGDLTNPDGTPMNLDQALEYADNVEFKSPFPNSPADDPRMKNPEVLKQLDHGEVYVLHGNFWHKGQLLLHDNGRAYTLDDALAFAERNGAGHSGGA